VKSRVTLSVYNTLGQEISSLVSEVQEAGYHELRYSAGNLSSGVYIYRLQAGSYVQSRRFVLIK
jgi:hypothetical protein